ncbi:LuxR C-terminal-related transcriptional regulator [Streptomyces sp. NPDC059009]|uniref:helix-turn-helix transcriptional regulator n=1 Tax=Streptomyces sp. NPDC059009 TaxID=3346694 RepID=UPI00368ED2F5
MTRERRPTPGAGPARVAWPAGTGQVERGERLLRQTGRLVVLGPWGAGRTTLLSALAARQRAEGRADHVLRLAPRPRDRALPYGAVAALFAQLPGRGALEGGQLAAVEGVLGEGSPGKRATGEAPPPDPLALRLALGTLLARLPGHVLLTVDDTQWLDEDSADVLGHVVRALAPDRLAVVCAERAARRADVARGLCGDHAPRLCLGPVSAEEVADLLVCHGVPGRHAARVHRYGGGHPLLVQALAEAMSGTSGAAVRSAHVPVPGDHVRELAELWLGTVSDEVRHTLLMLGLSAGAVSPALLRRAGRADADAHLAAADQAGIVRTGADPHRDAVTFTADALRDAAARTGGRPQRVAAHQALATATEDPLHATRHRLLALERPDGRLARQGQEAARWARDCGERALAAELLLLAAEHTPVRQRAERIGRLVEAARDAAAAGRCLLALRAADALAAARAGARDQVAALLAVVDTGGQAMDELEDVLARALDLARPHPALLAAVELRVALRHNISGRPFQARHAAERAVRTAESAHDPTVRTLALTMRARMERITGDPGAAHTLARALEAGTPVGAIGIRNSPQYLAVRHAVFDDRLAAARDRLMELLPVAERTGDAEDLQEVLRSLAEVDARLGAPGRALEWSERATVVCAAAGLSPGPSWYTAALAETAGGSFARAAERARLGAQSSREDHDLLFTSRNLLALGSVQLATGEVAAAVATLREVAELEGHQRVDDPTMLRWQPELAEALAAHGGPDEGRLLVDRLRATAGDRVLATGIGPALDRAEAACLARLGAEPRATDLLRRAAARFHRIGLPLEEARTHLALGRLERTRRRHAAARTAWRAALVQYQQSGAHPWTALTQDLLHRLDATATRADTPHQLTEAERKVAALVATGMTNQEAADQLYLSVKTVEATLSRVYRKLGIRSRAQLPRARGMSSGERAPRA